MIRFVILALVAYVFYRALKNWMTGGGAASRKQTTGNEADDTLIQDPVCKTYFTQRDGVHLRHEGRDLYFCSPKCRERYLLDTSSPEDRSGGA
ncbi:MAG: hypothetical protein QNI89_13270 [Desulfobacterales bacterium]|nr:hypothetical protein [Desulfobacterales bacterium]